MSEIRRTLFHADHVALGGRMVEFAGFELPVQYSSLLEEHHAVRKRCGLFDVSHMGEFFVRGPGATDFVQYLVTNDVEALVPGAGVLYTPMCRPDGGIVDDLLVYRLAADELLLVVNAANVAKDFAWCQSLAGRFDCRLENASDAWSQLALQGPQALNILAPLTPAALDELAAFRFVWTTVDGIECLLSRTGYTGEDGFEIYFSGTGGRHLFRRLIDAGAVPAGLGCRDSLRFEAKLLLYGNDMDDTTGPIEAALGWTVKFSKGDFSGREFLLRQKEEGTARKLVGLKLTGRGIPRHGYPVLAPDGRPIGVVSSGTKSPTLGDALALAYVETAASRIGTELAVEIRGKAVPAVVVKTPFYRRG